MSAQNRKDDLLPLVCFNRSNRINNKAGGYYYNTREGEVRGSFATEAKARYDLNQFIELIMLEKELQAIELLLAA
jgi:hypothetical protein